MTIASRLSRLFQADIHAMLDQLEEPEALLRQSLREMEDQLAIGEHQLANLLQSQQQQSRALASTEAALIDIGPQLDLCFAAGDETLARRLLRRRLELEQQCRQWRESIERRGETIAGLRKDLCERQMHCESIRQRAEALVAPAPHESAGEMSCYVSDDAVEIAFLAEQQRRTKTQGGKHE